VREIRRAMDAALKAELRIDPALDLYAATPHEIRYTDVELAALIAKITAFFTLIMELDGAYCFPLQDMLGELDKEKASRSGWREALRLANLMIERNENLTPIPPETMPPIPGITDRTFGVPAKFRFIRNLMRLAFLASPFARRLARRFLLELDPKKVGLDEADWYFCLRRNTHNYRGVPITERLAELRRIDAERGHQYVKIEYRQATRPEPRAEAELEPPKI
jgi:hypothetical protein